MSVGRLVLGKAEPRNIEEARERLTEVQAKAKEVILIMTAESALKAQKVVREAGRPHRD